MIKKKDYFEKHNKVLIEILKNILEYHKIRVYAFRITIPYC